MNLHGYLERLGDDGLFCARYASKYNTASKYYTDMTQLYSHSLAYYRVTDTDHVRWWQNHKRVSTVSWLLMQF